MALRLMVSTPLDVVLSEVDVQHVRAEDASGSFGVLPGHTDMVTALTASVVRWRDGRRREHFVAVRGGLLRVSGGDTVEIASREAVPGDNLAALEEAVLVRFREMAEAEQAARSQAARLQTAAIHQIIRFLRGRQGRPPETPRIQTDSIKDEAGS